MPPVTRRPSSRPAKNRRRKTTVSREKLQTALNESESFYASLVESLPQNILRKDLAGRFTFANARFCDAVGRPLDQIVGKTDFDLYPADSRGQVPS